MRHRVVLAAVICLLVTAGSRPAMAAHDLSSYMGRWAGLSQQLAPGELAPPCLPSNLVIVSAHNRRLQGYFELVPAVMPVELTVSDSGIVNGGGHTGRGMRVAIHGQVRAFGDGSVRFLADGSVRIASIHFALMGDGSVRKGFAAFVQMIGGADWDQIGGANVTGRWMGTWNSSVGPGGGCLDADLMNVLTDRKNPTTGLIGLAMFEDFLLGDGSVDLLFGLQGTIGLPAVQDGTSNTALIGLLRPGDNGGSTHGIIAVLIGLLLPAVQDNPTELRGQYLLYNSLGELYMDFTRGGSRLDQGSFALPAVQ